ncbi:MAG: hypothetical protein KDA92_12995 [Planctomycetales bacterium]|nr:hypothetical protein [Planctomycetales bacterium]MCA9171323.1 hypothetical protein [Planctomycetales bacterium]
MTIGCGTTREKLATEQLLLSDAVDRAVAQVDFKPLSGETVFLDSSYVRQIKPTSLVSADYVISALRQQMVIAGCLLQDNREEATYVVEARVGALGSDAYDMNFGVPGSQGISQAASLVTSVPILPPLPDISFARRTDDSAAAKVAIFAYHRETREPVLQSGTCVGRSDAHASWVLGAGPFQRGSIHEGTRFAGDNIRSSSLRRLKSPEKDMHPEDDVFRTSAVWDEKLQNKLREESSDGAIEDGTTDVSTIASADVPAGDASAAPPTESSEVATAAAAVAPDEKAKVEQAEFKSDASAEDPKHTPPVEKSTE